MDYHHPCSRFDPEFHVCCLSFPPPLFGLVAALSFVALRVKRPLSLESLVFGRLILGLIFIGTKVVFSLVRFSIFCCLTAIVDLFCSFFCPRPQRLPLFLVLGVSLIRSLKAVLFTAGFQISSV